MGVQCGAKEREAGKTPVVNPEPCYVGHLEGGQGSGVLAGGAEQGENKRKRMRGVGEAGAWEGLVQAEPRRGQTRGSREEGGRGKEATVRVSLSHSEAAGGREQERDSRE